MVIDCISRFAKLFSLNTTLHTYINARYINTQVLLGAHFTKKVILQYSNFVRSLCLNYILKRPTLITNLNNLYECNHTTTKFNTLLKDVTKDLFYNSVIPLKTTSNARRKNIISTINFKSCGIQNMQISNYYRGLSKSLTKTLAILPQSNTTQLEFKAI